MRDKMKGMSLLQKLDYLWTYYKIWLLVPIIIGVILNVVYSAYRANQENILVSAIVIGAGESDTSELEEGLKKYMKQTGKNDKVTIQNNITSGDLTPDTLTVLTTLIGAASVDVFVCPQNVYEHFSDRQSFSNVKEVLGDDVEKWDNAELTEKGDALIVKNSSFLREQTEILYEDVYLAIVETKKHPEGKKAFVEYILENQ